MGTSLTAQKVQYLGRAVEPPIGCPLHAPEIEADFQDLVRRSGRFSLALGDHAMERDDTTAWLHQAAAQAKPFLRPWVMEILFVLGAHRVLRFSELEQGLGISSKVLASRLKDLVDAGQIKRRIEATTPVTITYQLSKAGRATAALAAPLFTHLNLLQA